jgi:RimJ/RimL family protein N-acetyltransferase
VTIVAHVTLRPARSSDAPVLLAWRNDPETRAASFTSSPVTPGDHAGWLRDALARADRRLYVAEVAGEPVGTARLDLDGDVGIVSLTVSPEHRGRGVGADILRALADEAFATLAELRRLVARVKRANARSRAVFERAGFRLVEDGPTVILERERRGVGSR